MANDQRSASAPGHREGSPAGLNGGGPQSKYWVFTLNNPSDSERDALLQLFNDDKVGYLVFGNEVGESGTPHLQGYLELSTRKRRSYLSGLDGLGRAYLAPRRGSQDDAINYAKKDLNFKEVGLPSTTRQGTRSDLLRVSDRLQEGASLQEIAREFPVAWIRHYGGITSLYSRLRPRLASPPLFTPRWESPEDVRSLVMHGPSGTGKTTAAKGYLQGALWVTHLDGLAHFDPLVHNGIIFDDMSFKHLHREAQIHLLDWDEPRDIHIRYTTVHIPAHTKKIFTCNDLYAVFDIQDAAIRRRMQTMECSL